MPVDPDDFPGFSEDFREAEAEAFPGFASDLERIRQQMTPEERRRRLLEAGALPGLAGERGSEAFDPPGYGRAYLGLVGNVTRSGAVGLANLLLRPLPGRSPLQGAADEFRRREEAATARLAEASADTSPALAGLGFWTAQVAGMALDPLELLPGGLLAKGGTAAGRGVRAAAKARRLDDVTKARRGERLVGEAEDVLDEGGKALREEIGEGNLPVRRDAKLEPPEDPFQYSYGSLDVPEGVVEDVKEAARRPETHRRRRTGVKVDYKDTKRLEAELNMTEDDFLLAEPGRLFNREEGVLLDAYIGRRGQEVNRLQEAARADLAKGNASSRAVQRYADARVRWIDLLGVSMANRSEAGRALESYKHLRTALDSPESLRAYLGRKMAKAVKEGKIKEMDLDLLARADLDNPREIGDLLRKLNKPEWWEYPRELFFSSILSGLGTHGRNFIGNALHAASQIPVRVGAAAVDTAVSKLTKRQRQVYMAEVLPSIYGMVDGFHEGLQRAGALLRRDLAFDGGSKFDVPRGAFRRAPNEFVREKIAPAVEIPFKALAAADALFKGISRGAELRALATRSGVKKGLTGDKLVDHVSKFLQNPPKKALRQAVEFEEFMTFTNDLGKVARLFSQAKDASPFLGYVIPFVKTPVNLFKAGARWTPFNAPRAIRDLVKERPGAAEEVAKTVLGSGLMGWAMTRAMAGELTGPPPVDAGERAGFYAQGKKPFSVRVGDRWFSFSQIEPLAMPLAIAAAATEGAKRSDMDATKFERLQGAMALLVVNQLDRSYLSGLADLFELVTYGEQAIQSFAGRQAAALMVPYSGLTRQVANLIDTRIVDKNSIGDFVKANVPGLKNTLPARLDRWGEEIRRSRFEALGPTGTPFVPSRAVDDNIDAKLSELGLRVGFPGKSIEGVELSDQEYRKVLGAMGPRTKAVLERLLSDSAFSTLDRATQQRYLDRFVDGVRDQVRTEALLGALPGVPPLLTRKDLSSHSQAFNRQRSGLSRQGANRGTVGGRLKGQVQDEQRWRSMYGDLGAAVDQARRRGMTDAQIRGLMLREGVPKKVVRALLAGDSWKEVVP